MTRKRRIGTMAAFGGLAAAATLLAASPATRADELADLKANQELLQKKLDQLQLALGAAPLAPGSPSLTGSFPRSIRIPGTDTSLAIGGFARLNLDWFITGGGPSNGTNGTANNTIGENGTLLSTPLDVAGKSFRGVPVASTSFGAGQLLQHARVHSFSMNVRESRLRVETRTPTSLGEAGTVIEFDFAGAVTGSQLHVPDSLIPRLRLAYGTLGPWLAGQSYSTFNDLSSHPTTLDFGGPVGESGTVRPPQLRYTFQLPYGLNFQAAIEAPDTTVLSAAGGFARDDTSLVSGFEVNPAKNTYPDLVGALYLERPWGHISFRGVMTNEQFQDGRFIDRQFVGYGGAVSGNMKPGWLGWTKDNITFGATAVDGADRYLNGSDTWDLATNYTGPVTSRAAAAGIIVKTVKGWQAHGGYEHWWAPTLRSTASFGIQDKYFPSDLIGTQALTANKRLYVTHLNLIWSPISFIDTGVEWVYGHRRTTANLNGNLNVVIGQVTVKF